MKNKSRRVKNRTSRIAGTRKRRKRKKEKKEDVEKIRGERQILFVLSTYFGKVRGLL